MWLVKEKEGRRKKEGKERGRRRKEERGKEEGERRREEEGRRVIYLFLTISLSAAFKDSLLSDGIIFTDFWVF